MRAAPHAATHVCYSPAVRSMNITIMSIMITSPIWGAVIVHS
jgi:hypothetical protein